MVYINSCLPSAILRFLLSWSRKATEFTSNRYNMCFAILVNEDRFLEMKKAGRERRRRFIHMFLPCLRPAVTVDGGAPQQEDVIPPQYASKTSLLLNKEVVG
jgi:hypothetical protein